MQAGFAKIDITPKTPVWMDGMIRAHKSAGVHDPIFAKALVCFNGVDVSNSCLIVSVDVCGLLLEDCDAIRKQTEQKFGIPYDKIIVAAIHNHSGPATVGYHNDRERVYTEELIKKIIEVIGLAVANAQPVMMGAGLGEERTISHYRRLLADDGHVVMNWEPWPKERVVKTLGVIDPDVMVLKFISADDPNRLVGLLFDHAGHPNVMSGDNYLISSDYPGWAEAALERKLGCSAVFVNGAQGTMDIDGLKDRDWEGVERVGGALADVVEKTAVSIECRSEVDMIAGSVKYDVPARKISDEQKAWSEGIIAKTGGALQAVADGVGDDHKAALYLNLRKVQDKPILFEQVCLAFDDCACLSFPGELFTEIGMSIKAASPFKHTFIIGLANGNVGYVPTRKAITEGGYEPDVRVVDDSAEDIVFEKSVALLRDVYNKREKQ